MEKLLLFILLLSTSCQRNLCKKFDYENQTLKDEWKSQFQKFVKLNADKLTEKQILESIDSIGELYIVTKNKNLAIKYIRCEKGIGRLNYLKDKFSKNELQNLLQKVPKNLKSDTNYISMKTYLEP